MHKYSRIFLFILHYAHKKNRQELVITLRQQCCSRPQHRYINQRSNTSFAQGIIMEHFYMVLLPRRGFTTEQSQHRNYCDTDKKLWLQITSHATFRIGNNWYGGSLCTPAHVLNLQGKTVSITCIQRKLLPPKKTTSKYINILVFQLIT